MTTVSIIVPMYNVASYLVKCIESIVNQTYRNIEIILVDDGSSDNTKKICDKWLDIDDRIRYIYQNNQGLGPARHTGINNSKGEYIAFVDSDDWVSKDFVEKMLFEAESQKADLVICNFYSVYDEDVVQANVNIGNSDQFATIGDRIKSIKSNSIWKTLTKRTLWTDYKIVMPALPYEDLASFPLLVAMSKKIAAVEEPLYFYRCGRKGSIINNPQYYMQLTETVGFLRQEAIRLGLYYEYINEFSFLIKNNVEYILEEARKSCDDSKQEELVKGYAAFFSGYSEWADIVKSVNKKNETIENIKINKLKKKSIVGICIPYYNDIGALRRLINSINKQTYKNIRVVITSDSKDEIAKELVMNNGFIYVQNDERLGATANCNKAIYEVCKQKVDYIKVMHQDDYFASEESLEWLVNMLDSNPKANIVFCGTVQDNQDSKFERGISKEEVGFLKNNKYYLLEANVIGAPSAVMIRNLSIYMDERLVWLVDVDWYLKVLENNNCFVYTREPLIGIGISDNQLTNKCESNKTLVLEEYAYLYYKYFRSKSGYSNLVSKLCGAINQEEIEDTPMFEYDRFILTDKIRNQIPIIIFGNGKNAKEKVMPLLLKYNANIIAFCDNNPKMWGKTNCAGIKCYSVEEVAGYFCDALIVISTQKDIISIKNQLKIYDFQYLEFEDVMNLA